MTTTYTYDVMEAAEWGMRWDRPPVSTTNPSPFGYQHHTAGNTMATLRDENGNGLNADEAFRRINEMAIGEGMSAIDYTALVHESESGRVTVGIARGPWLPAATYKQNEVSKAVCAMGYFHPGHALSSHPSAGMLEGCAIAWAELHRRGWVTRDAIANLRGHRQNPYSIGDHATACPGDYLFPHVPSIGSRALELVDGTPPPPTPAPGPPPVTTPTGVATMGAPLVLRYGGTPTANWSGYFSFDGITRHGVRGMHHAAQLVALGAIDAKTGKPVLSGAWSDVTHTTNAEELDEWLTPGRD